MGQSQREVGQLYVVVPAILLVQAPCLPAGWRSGPGALGADTLGLPTQSFLEILGKTLTFPRTLRICNYRTG